MIKNTIFVCSPWAYHKEKEEKHLLIWPDLPRWMIVDKELYLILKLFDGKKNIDVIIDIISKKFKKKPSEINEMINKILPTLIEYGVVYKKGEKKPTSEIQGWKIKEININVTSRCNLQCKMCFNKYNKIPIENELSSEEIKKFLDQFMEFADESALLTITGGESLLVQEKALEVAEHAKKIGIKTVAIITNGTLVTKEFAKKAKKLNLKIMVSLDGANEKEHDYLRGIGSFKRTINGIKILVDEGLEVMTNYMVHKDNFESLKDYYDLALTLKVDMARFISLKRMGGGKDKKSLKVVPIDKLLKSTYELFQDHPEYSKLTGVDLVSIFAGQCKLSVKRGWCGTGKTIMLLDADGSVYPCPGHILPEFKAGNIRERSFSEIWLNSPVLIKLRKTYNVDTVNKKCSKCIVRHWCLGGCRGEAYQSTGRMDSPDIQCKALKRMIMDMFWLLAEHPELGKGKINLTI